MSLEETSNFMKGDKFYNVKRLKMKLQKSSDAIICE